jgi:hypothetical protein
MGFEFPFYGYTVTDTLVTSDGTLAFSLPNQQYAGPIDRCFPTGEFHFFVIAPFRADLDPSLRVSLLDRLEWTTILVVRLQVPHVDRAGASTDIDEDDSLCFGRKMRRLRLQIVPPLLGQFRLCGKHPFLLEHGVYRHRAEPDGRFLQRLSTRQKSLHGFYPQ